MNSVHRILTKQARLLPAEWWLVVNSVSFQTLKPLVVTVYSLSKGRDPVHPLNIELEISGRESCDRIPDIQIGCPANTSSVFEKPLPFSGTGRDEMSWHLTRTEDGASDLLLVGVITHREMVANHCDYWREAGHSLKVSSREFELWWNDGTAQIGY